MSIKILQPSCNLETVRDGRGGIFTWLPKEPIVEFNMLFFKPGKTRVTIIPISSNIYCVLKEMESWLLEKTKMILKLKAL